MEDNGRWLVVTAIAPVAWGTNYYVTRRFLPSDVPLYGAAMRALPAGALLFAVRRRWPRGSWWWKSFVLGTLNIGAFFVLIYVAAQRLPTSVASPIMATAPMAMMLIAWAMVAERPRLLAFVGAAIGMSGVALMLSTAAVEIDPLGIAASLTAMVMSSLGYVLAKRWSGQVDVLASTSWQLLAGGITLVPLAAAVEGPPPHLDASAGIAMVYVTVVATALAFVAWFAGLAHLRAATVGLIGLLNPVTGVLLGTLVASEAISARQCVGIAMVLAGIVVGQRHASPTRIHSPASVVTLTCRCTR